MPSLHSTTSTAFFFLIFSLHSLTGGPSRPSHIQLLFFCHRCRPFSFGKFQCAFRKAVKERCCFFSFLLCVYASAVTGGDKVRFPPPPPPPFFLSPLGTKNKNHRRHDASTIHPLWIRQRNGICAPLVMEN